MAKYKIIEKKRGAWRVVLTGLIAAVCVYLPGCSSSGPEAIHFGQDQCDYCRMTIVDKSFASELVTAKGKAYKFDSIECLAAYHLKESIKAADVRGNWVATVDRPGELKPLEEVHLVFSEKIHSPMGVGLSAHLTKESADASIQANAGAAYSWEQVMALIKFRWSP